MPTTTPQEEPRRPVPTMRPAVDVYETQNGYVVLADMPGVTPDRLSVDVDDGQLTIHGVPAPPAVRPTHQEYVLPEYRRTFTLADELDSERITAKLQDGVLRLEVPKAPKAQVRRIPVVAA